MQNHKVQNESSKKPRKHLSSMDETHQTVITCHDLSYTVKVKNKCSKVDKVVLKNINGIFKPGLNAILGATGSGKTSLLDTLAGRKDPVGVSGNVLVNGAPQPKNFKCMTGYVVQDDVVMGTLTVRENLMFSANMRMPQHIPQKEKAELVDSTIQELGLSRCADTKVGNQFIRGISGGERKRTNIGMELIVSPSLLFLDEPTSGLDSNTANAVMRLLSRISKNGRTIIFSIHQPRYSIYKLFDRLLMLVQGEIVYHGPQTEALGYFNSLGYICEEHNNPADFFLDILNGDPDTIKDDTVHPVAAAIENSKEQEKDLSKLENGLGQVNPALETDSNYSDGKQNVELAHTYLESAFCQQVMDELGPIFKNYENRTNNEDAPVMRGEYATGFGTQMKHLSQRTITNIVRNPATTVLQVLVTIVLAIICGVLYLDLGYNFPAAEQNRIGLFFFCIMNMVFSNMGAIELFIKERAVYIHEHSNGFYRTSSYFVSKILFDFVPLRIIPVIFYTSVLYFMAGLTAEADRFFFFMLTLTFTSLASAANSFMIGATFGIYAVAHILTAMNFVLAMIFGGFFLNIESIWVGVRWLQYFSLFRYALRALAINELRGLEYKALNMTSGKYDITSPAEDYLERQDIDYKTNWDLWQNILALGCLTIGFLTIAYIQLRRINKYR